MRERPKTRWLIIPIESKAREFDAKVFLALIAAERGYGVVFGSNGQIRRWLDCMPKGMLLDKSLSINKESHLKDCAKMGFLISANDEESFAIFSETERWLHVRLSKKTLEMASCFFAWSEGQAQILRDAYPEFANKITVTGTPRSDMWSEKLRGLYEEKANAIVEKYGRYILLPSNFSSVINVSGQDFILEQARQYGHLKTSEDESWLKDQLDHKKRNLDEFVNALFRIRKEFTRHAIIVRPHPTDDHEFWCKTSNAIENLHVVFDDKVTPWLLGANVVVHHGCSTGIEAYLLGRHVISYHPYWDDRFEGHPSSRIGSVVKDEDSLIEEMRRALNGPGVKQVELDHIKTYLEVTPHGFASERMVDAFDKIAWESADTLDLSVRNMGLLKMRTWEMIKRIARRVVCGFRTKALDRERTERRGRQKFSGASLEEVDAIVAQLSATTGRFSALSVSEVTDEIFTVTKKNAH